MICPYIHVGELKEVLEQTLQRLGGLGPKDEIFLTLEKEGGEGYGEEYYISFNIPTNVDKINKKVIGDAVRNIETLRKAKEEDEKRKVQKEIKKKIAKEKEEELGRLIVSLQIGKITPEEFKNKSDAIYKNR